MPDSAHRRRLRWCLFLVITLLGVGLLIAATVSWLFPTRGFVSRVYKDADGGEYRYQIFIPHDYHPWQRRPVILFLHGAGQTGTDGEAQIHAGLGDAIRRQEQSFPFLVVFPQSTKRTWNADSDDGHRALEILDNVCREYAVDEDLVYLTGFSMGGGGTWSLAAATPDRWAAIAPVCGYGDPAWAKELARLPCWCFHGTNDRVIAVGRSQEMVQAVRAAGGTVKYTEYPGVDHNSWDRTYASEELFDWLLSHRRSSQ
jgi:predicted peptidase